MAWARDFVQLARTISAPCRRRWFSSGPDIAGIAIAVMMTTMANTSINSSRLNPRRAVRGMAQTLVLILLKMHVVGRAFLSVWAERHDVVGIVADKGILVGTLPGIWWDLLLRIG